MMKILAIATALILVLMGASTVLADDPDGRLASAKDHLELAIAQIEAEIAQPPAVTTVTETATVTATVTETVTPPPPTTPPPTTPPPTTPPPTTSPPTQPPPAGFPTRAQALARANVVVSSGSSSAQYRVGSPPADTTYDLRDHTTTAFPNTHAFPYSFGRDSAATRIVVIGGHAIGTQPRNWSWDQVHAVGGAGTTMLGSDFQVSYDFYTENQHDGIQMLPPSGGGSEYLIDGLTCVWIRDDCIEADTEFSGTIRNVVGRDVNTAISLGQSSKNPNAVTTIENAVFVHVPMVNAKAADGIGHQTLFKQAPGGRVNMTNVTDCMYENPITPSRIQIRPQGTWTNVVFVLGPGWVGPDPQVPAGASVSRDWEGLCTV